MLSAPQYVTNRQARAYWTSLNTFLLPLASSGGGHKTFKRVNGINSLKKSKMCMIGPPSSPRKALSVGLLVQQARNLRRCALKAGKTSTRKTENLAHLTYPHTESGMR